MSNMAYVLSRQPAGGSREKLGEFSGEGALDRAHAAFAGAIQVAAVGDRLYVTDLVGEVWYSHTHVAPPPAVGLRQALERL